VCHLGGAHQGQRLAQREIPPPGLVEQVVEPAARRLQAERRQHLGQAVELGIHYPPPAICSYSASGRNSSPAAAGAAQGRHQRIPVVGDDADQVGAVENTLTPAAALVVTSDHPGVEDAHHASRHLDPNPGADQPPGHAVVVGVEIDRAVRLHPADHLAHLPERRPAHQRRQRLRLLPPEPLDRWLAGDAMEALIGNQTRCASSAAQQAKPWPAIAFFFT
jgi:hypothetical protein